MGEHWALDSVGVLARRARSTCIMFVTRLAGALTKLNKVHSAAHGWLALVPAVPHAVAIVTLQLGAGSGCT